MAQAPAVPEGFSSTIQFLANGTTAGLLQPGDSDRVPIYYAGWQQPWDFQYPPFEFTLDVVTAEDDAPFDWNAYKVDFRPDSIDPAAWGPIWSNFRAQVGDTLLGSHPFLALHAGSRFHDRYQSLPIGPVAGTRNEQGPEDPARYDDRLSLRDFETLAELDLDRLQHAVWTDTESWHERPELRPWGLRQDDPVHWRTELLLDELLNDVEQLWEMK